MKTYRIELQRLKALTHDKDLIELKIDALVLPATARGDQEPTTCLSLSERDARSLMLLLKQHFAAAEQKNKGRSQR